MVFLSSLLVVLVAAAAAISQTVNITGVDVGEFYYSFWAEDGADVTFSNYSGVDYYGEYIIEWNETARFFGGKGWSPGSATTVVQFTTDYDQTGSSQLALYGSTTDPLVEYFITESFSGSLAFADLELKGNVTSDGSVYNIYEGQRVDAKGNAPFRQYWSVRQSIRSRGVLTTANHFNAWATLGMPLGDFGHQIFAVESHAGSGSIYVFMSGVTSCVAQYAQCGGIGFTGPTCCNPGLVCTESNPYFYNCYVPGGIL